MSDGSGRYRILDISDTPQLWDIFRVILADGTTYVQDETTDTSSFAADWFGRGGVQWGLVHNNHILGAYTLRPNQVGRGNHVGTASFIIDAAVQGQGLGTELGRHCLEAARELGFRAMQFNFVVSTNQPAVKLWKGLGFEIVGVLPEAFRHNTAGFVDVYVMYRML
jgi:ribosomal protein S18 acetylase RimI-like enzyme